MPDIATLNELSTVIGELRNFAAQQVATNTHILNELKRISERMAGINEMSAVFGEYRKTLHERFGKIHEQITEIDEDIERADTRLVQVELLVNSWKSNWKMAAAIVYVIVTITSAILSSYGSSIVKGLTH